MHRPRDTGNHDRGGDDSYVPRRSGGCEFHLCLVEEVKGRRRGPPTTRTHRPQPGRSIVEEERSGILSVPGLGGGDAPIRPFYDRTPKFPSGSLTTLQTGEGPEDRHLGSSLLWLLETPPPSHHDFLRPRTSTSPYFVKIFPFFLFFLLYLPFLSFLFPSPPLSSFSPSSSLTLRLPSPRLGSRQ